LLYFSYFYIFGPLAIYIENKAPGLENTSKIFEYYVFRKPSSKK
jgi:hypothetical protein